MSKLDLQLTLELWYTEHGQGLATAGINSPSSVSSPSITNTNGSSIQSPVHQTSSGIECVSSRILNINLNPLQGIHYHLPVLFDYFHLSAVSLTIHAALVSLHQPYIK